MLRLNMRRFEMKKLVRDKIPQIINKQGGNAEEIVLNNKDFLRELKNKFYEELEEFDPEDKENAKNELSDLQEIIDNFLKALNISKNDLEKFQKEKNEKAGSFSKKIFVSTVSIPEKSSWIEYYTKRYKEIK
jgi:predicted house-cleaning noncanonical NTP pyrophosphatase (MazG superfamily)